MDKMINKMDWHKGDVESLFQLPFFELIERAYATLKRHFDCADMELCTLLSVKTGGCPEDCAYCPQSAHYHTGVKREKLLDIDAVVEQAKKAKQNGAQRFCMGAAWRSPPKKEFPQVLKMIKAVKALGLETCVTLGMLNDDQAQQLKNAGLDFYNHNLDTSAEFYAKIITTRSYQDRLETLAHVMTAGINVCCGGILGMGESRADRIEMLLTLSKLPQTPQSIPINQLMAIEGTPLGKAKPIDRFEFIKTIAVTRIMFPSARVRLSAGREYMTDEMQAWCYMAGANSIFIGDTLLTEKNPSQSHDRQLLSTLGLETSRPVEAEVEC